MKRHRGWSLLLSLLVVMGIASLVAAQQPRSGGTLRVAWEADISGLDPHLSFGMQARLPGTTPSTTPTSTWTP